MGLVEKYRGSRECKKRRNSLKKNLDYIVESIVEFANADLKLMSMKINSSDEEDTREAKYEVICRGLYLDKLVRNIGFSYGFLSLGGRELKEMLEDNGLYFSFLPFVHTEFGEVRSIMLGKIMNEGKLVNLFGDTYKFFEFKTETLGFKGCDTRNDIINLFSGNTRGPFLRLNDECTANLTVIENIVKKDLQEIQRLIELEEVRDIPFGYCMLLRSFMPYLENAKKLCKTDEEAVSDYMRDLIYSYLHIHEATHMRFDDEYSTYIVQLSYTKTPIVYRIFYEVDLAAVHSPVYSQGDYLKVINTFIREEGDAERLVCNATIEDIREVAMRQLESLFKVEKA